MRFLLRRYFLGIASRRRYLWLALLPPFLYAVMSALRPDAYSVTQQLALSEASPVVVSRDPSAFRRLDEVVAEGRFFEDPAALRDLRTRERRGELAAREPVEVLIRNLALRLLPDERVEIEYRGEDPRLGRGLVEFYAFRLVAMSEEGSLRVTSQPLSRALEAGIRPDAPPARLIGAPQVAGHRSLWKRERAGPLLMIALLSFVAALIALCLVEWRDPSFKSERQVARYLGIPILGSVPDLGPLAERLGQPDRPGGPRRWPRSAEIPESSNPKPD